MMKYEDVRKVKENRKLSKECERDQKFHTSILWDCFLGVRLIRNQTKEIL